MMTSNHIFFSLYFTLILEVQFDVVIKNILPKSDPTLLRCSLLSQIVTPLHMMVKFT